MKIGRMAWAGFGIALIGWVLLVINIVASDAQMRAGSLVATVSLRSDVATIAQAMIISGFGLAIVGTLRAGFGAFTRFFDAVLQRSAAPRPKGANTLEPEPIDTDPPYRPEAPPQRPEVVTVSPADTVERHAPERPAPERPTVGDRLKASRGRDRNFVILPDGSVEVETMFGTRVFATLDEAKDFIR